MLAKQHDKKTEMLWKQLLANTHEYADSLSQIAMFTNLHVGT